LIQPPTAQLRPVARFLALCTLESMSERIARDIGVLAGRTHHDGIVDVAVGRAPSAEETASSRPTTSTSVPSRQQPALE
jgi:hypothetical protein